MARFDVYSDADGVLSVDVRADGLHPIRRLVLIPLLPVAAAPLPIDRLNPVVIVRGAKLVLMTQYIASVPKSDAGTKVDNIELYWDEIMCALDVLLTGF